MSSIRNVGPQPEDDGDIVTQSYTAEAIAKDIDHVELQSRIDAAAALRRDGLAKYQADLQSHISVASMAEQGSAYYKLSEGGQPNGFAVKQSGAIAPGAILDMPAARWGGPYEPEEIFYDAAARATTSDTGVVSRLHLCTFTLPALKSGLPSVPLIFGQLEVAGIEAHAVPEVLVYHGTDLVGWGIGYTGTDRNMLNVTPQHPSGYLPSTGPITLDVYLTSERVWETNSWSASVALRAIHHLVAFRAPVAAT